MTEKKKLTPFSAPQRSYLPRELGISPDWVSDFLKTSLQQIEIATNVQENLEKKRLLRKESVLQFIEITLLPKISQGTELGLVELVKLAADHKQWFASKHPEMEHDEYELLAAIDTQLLFLDIYYSSLFPASPSFFNAEVAFLVRAAHDIFSHYMQENPEVMFSI